MQTRKWPPYLRARRTLDGSALDAALLEWVIGLVAAELAGEAGRYVRYPGRLIWIELRGFQVLAQVTLDQSGRLDRIDLLDARKR